MLEVGSKVEILNLKNKYTGKIIEKFKHGSIEYFRVIYQNKSKDTFMITTNKENLKLI